MDPYRTARPGFHYKIINVNFINKENWKSKIELELEKASEEGWRPILCGDGGNAFTIILEKPKD